MEFTISKYRRGGRFGSRKISPVPPCRIYSDAPVPRAARASGLRDCCSTLFDHEDVVLVQMTSLKAMQQLTTISYFLRLAALFSKTGHNCNSVPRLLQICTVLKCFHAKIALWVHFPMSLCFRKLVEGINAVSIDMAIHCAPRFARRECRVEYE